MNIQIYTDYIKWNIINGWIFETLEQIQKYTDYIKAHTYRHCAARHARACSGQCATAEQSDVLFSCLFKGPTALGTVLLG